APDIIHVHGWLASLLPLYLREYYKDEPLFSDSKIVTSVYNQSFDSSLNKEMIGKVKFDNIDDKAIEVLADPTYVNIMKVAVDYSDALVVGSDDIPADLNKYLKSSKKPVLEYHGLEDFAEAYTEFYKSQVLS
ncbi:MAG: glycogen/starch synthase, partial [Bacteroidia bacterium]|nr:glycogen/starch synthase [Bacteroidia bacterium]